MVQAPIRLAGATLLADPAGVLVWPERALLAVADLHLEKGSGLARRGRLLPPYDTRATLDRLEAALRRLRPRTVVCLGDSLHDAGAVERIAPADAARIRMLTAAHDWIWVAGNHDPEPPRIWGGQVAAELVLGPLTFRHQARPDARGEVSGHLHPAAAVQVRLRRVRARCFAWDGERLILPAFGAYAGGLNVLDAAVRRLLAPRFEVHLLGRDRLYRFPHHCLIPDPALGRAAAP